jgi:hypothetical protein
MVQSQYSTKWGVSDTTNYRLEICEWHDKPQFNFCFDCGAPLKEVILEGQEFWTCSKNSVHLKLWTIPHKGDLEDTDCEGIKVI